MKKLLKSIGCWPARKADRQHADPRVLGRAVGFVERFREIVSDPLNLLIERVPEAGYVDGDGCVILHNGNRVPVRGRFAYYREFSDILIVNRGVHEPLEEFCFQQLLRRLAHARPSMLELGAYWAHYSMWMMKRCPGASCAMVEPDAHNLEVGRRNFALNGYAGSFVGEAIGAGRLTLDRYVEREGILRLDVLHADIQGAELEMLEGGRRFLSAGGASYVLISTHSQALHDGVLAALADLGYRVEVSSAVDGHTTSSDGFVFASARAVEPVFAGFHPLGRLEIARSAPDQLLEYLRRVGKRAR